MAELLYSYTLINRNRLPAILRQLLIEVEPGQELITPAPQVPIREIFRRFWPYARPYRHWLCVTFLFLVLGPGIQTAAIWMFKILIDDVLVPRDFRLFGGIALAYLGLTVLGGLVYFCKGYLSAWVGGRFLALAAHQLLPPPARSFARLL